MNLTSRDQLVNRQCIVSSIHRYFFSTCGPNLTQFCSHRIGYIPVPIGLLFAIAPTHDWNGNGATQTCTWALRFKWKGWHCLVVH